MTRAISARDIHMVRPKSIAAEDHDRRRAPGPEGARHECRWKQAWTGREYNAAHAANAIIIENLKKAEREFQSRAPRPQIRDALDEAAGAAHRAGGGGKLLCSSRTIKKRDREHPACAGDAGVYIGRATGGYGGPASRPAEILFLALTPLTSLVYNHMIILYNLHGTEAATRGWVTE